MTLHEIAEMLEEMMPHSPVNLCLQEQFETADGGVEEHLKILKSVPVVASTLSCQACSVLRQRPGGSLCVMRRRQRLVNWQKVNSRNVYS